MQNGKGRKVSSLIQKRRDIAASAMPEVKKLVRRYGRAAISNCLAKIAAYERENKKLEKLRSEVRSMERRLQA